MSEKKQIFWKFHLPAIFWALIILLLCGIPGNKIPELTFLEWLNPDKFVHLILFGVLCILLLKGFERQNYSRALNKNAIFLALTLCIIYGCIIEILQEYFFINRSGDVRDAVANLFGTLFGLWVYKRYFGKTVNS